MSAAFTFVVLFNRELIDTLSTLPSPTSPLTSDTAPVLPATLVTGGVTPLECVSGEVSIVRGITTRTTTGGAADKTWRELTTVRIVDDVIPALRASLRARFVRSKNTAQVRAAIRSQVMVELENKRAQEIIDSFGEVSVKASEDDPTVCLVEFSFAVAHGLNRIYLSAHITV